MVHVATKIDYQKTIEAMVSHLDQGDTIYLSTQYRITKITPAYWRKYGQNPDCPLFRVSTRDGGLLLRQGKRYVDYSYSKITVH